MSEIRANTVSDAAGTGPATLTGQYAAKAWVNFNGTGTVAIRESGNVSSITDGGTGEYYVNFANAMSDVNYASVLGCCQLSGAIKVVINEQEVSNNNKSTSSLRIRSGYSTGSTSNIDTDGVYVAILR